MTPAPLTPADCDHAFRSVVPEWFLDGLDTRLGTADVVPLVRQAASLGVITGCPDGDYPEWALRVNAHRQGGLDVEIVHRDNTVRAGRMQWSNVANRATIAALQRRHETGELRPGEQGRLL